MKFDTVIVLCILLLILDICVTAFSFSKDGITVDYRISKWSECQTGENDFTGLATFEGTDIEQCVFECSLRQSCQSLDYLRRFKLCKLYASNDGTLENGQCVHIVRSDIIVHNAACACSSGDVCHTSTDDCVYEECHTIDIKYCTVAGNMKKVGSKLQVQCDFNTTMWTTECLKNGSWSFLPICKSKIYHCADVYDYTIIDLSEINIQGQSEIVFENKGNSNAHLLLQETKNELDNNVVEIVIGGWRNTKSVIRNMRQTSPQNIVETPNILDSNSYKIFWVSWNNSCVKVGHDEHPYKNEFMSWCGLTHSISAISVSYGYGGSGAFVFH